MSTAPKKKKTQKQIDEERLRKIESDIGAILKLLKDNQDRDKGERNLQGARARFQSQSGQKRKVFYDHDGAGGKLPLTNSSAGALDLAKALRHRIQLEELPFDLEEGLERLCSEQVQILERVLRRSQKKKQSSAAAPV